MREVKSVGFTIGSHVNRLHFLPTWLRVDKSLTYQSLSSLVVYDRDWEEDTEVGASEYIGVWGYSWLQPMQSMCHHFLMLFDAYDIGFKLDNSTSYGFSMHNLVSTDADVVDYDYTFQEWCKIYDKKGFNKKKSYQDWKLYSEINSYAFKKVAQLAFTIYELLDFTDYEEMYNWCLDVYDGKVVS